MKRLPIDLAALQTALEDYDGGLGLHTYWFDTRTGEVIFLTEDLEEQDELRQQIEEDSTDRFVMIDPISSHDGFRVMKDFVQSLPHTRLREKLEWCSDGPKPFRRFRDALYENKVVQGQWYKFHDEALARYAIAWLAELNIEPLSEAADGSKSGHEANSAEDSIEAEADEHGVVESGREPTISIRPATKDDRDAILKLARQLATSFVVERDAFKNSFQEILQSSDVYLAVAEKSGEVVAYVLGNTQPTFYANGPIGWVQELFVAPEHRLIGIGKLLMSDFECWAANRGYNLVGVATRRASDFYEAIGYSASATYYTKLL